MTERTGTLRIAVNTMRARLTILGFNIAIITFQIGDVRSLPGGVEVNGLPGAVHLPVSAALSLGFASAVAAMVLYIVSNDMGEQGLCDHWSMLCGDMLMYFSLSQTVMAFFEPHLYMVEQVRSTAEVYGLDFSLVHLVFVFAAGTAWTLAIYVGPAVSLLRSPFGRVPTVLIGLAYGGLLVISAGVGNSASQLQTVRMGESPAERPLLLRLAMPLHWYNGMRALPVPDETGTQ